MSGTGGVLRGWTFVAVATAAVPGARDRAGPLFAGAAPVGEVAAAVRSVRFECEPPYARDAMEDVEVEVVGGVSAVETDAWDRVASGGGPFVQYAFLAALEETGCVGAETGWMPQVLVARRETGEGRVVGAAPLYVKTHSAGEYVFDWGWAEAAQRSGLSYYPKGVVGVPFTPVTGGRLLVAPEVEDTHRVRRLLAEEAMAFADRSELSSVHFNFLRSDDREVLASLGLPIRENFQYHWYNGRRGDERGAYEDFDDFLGELRSKKRSNIRRERRKLREHGVEPSVRVGEEIAASDLRRMYGYYRRTVEKYFGGNLYLNEAFFLAMGREMGERLQMVVLEQGGEEFAAAFNVLGDDRLFGRYWGATSDVDFAHFEACFYSSVEWAIDRGIAVFEGGSGGDHKFDRGFVPTRTHSAHYVRHPDFERAIVDFIDREATEIDRKIEEMRDSTPYKRGESSG